MLERNARRLGHLQTGRRISKNAKSDRERSFASSYAYILYVRLFAFGCVSSEATHFRFAIYLKNIESNTFKLYKVVAEA
jgi:hypothetical protein